MFVEPGALVPQIVRADDRRIAAGIAEPDRALLQYRDIGDAVFLGEVIGGGEAMPAAADNHDVVARFRRRLAPERLPMAVPGQRVARQRGERETLHRRKLAPCPPAAKTAARFEWPAEQPAIVRRPPLLRRAELKLEADAL